MEWGYVARLLLRNQPSNTWPDFPSCCILRRRTRIIKVKLNVIRCSAHSQLQTITSITDWAKSMLKRECMRNVAATASPFRHQQSTLLLRPKQWPHCANNYLSVLVCMNLHFHSFHSYRLPYAHIITSTSKRWARRSFIFNKSRAFSHM